MKKISIDFSKVTSTGQAIETVGSILRTEDSAIISRESNLGGLADVVYDYFYEHFDDSQLIRLSGLKRLNEIDAYFTVNLIDSLYFAYLDSIGMNYRNRDSVLIGDVASLKKFEFEWE